MSSTSKWDRLEDRAQKALQAGERWHAEMPLTPPQYVLALMYSVNAGDVLANTMRKASESEEATPEEQAELSQEVQEAYLRYVKVRRALDEIIPRNLGEEESGEVSPTDAEAVPE